MKVNKIEFESFRNIDSEIIEFSDGINVIYGENAQGKTNLLEAIWLFRNGSFVKHGRKQIRLHYKIVVKIKPNGNCIIVK